MRKLVLEFAVSLEGFAALSVTSNFITVYKYLAPLVAVLFLFSCNPATQVKVQDVKLSEVKNEPEVPLPPVPAGLKVSAYLVYNDSTISTFDILNDRSIVLWNTIIGAGDAKKPSVKTLIRLTGKLDSLNLTIHNGKNKVTDQKLPGFSGDFDVIIDNTGCEEITINVTKPGKEIYRNNIPFRCGE